MKKSTTLFIALYLVFSNMTTLHAAPAISATAAIVMDVQTGFILYERNIHEARYPASIAKIMTALIALEQYSNRLYEPILFSANAVYSIPPNSSHIAMDEGESLSMEDALYAIMLASANEVAGAIAEHISGDISSFGELMTRRAAALGAVNTHFTNPSGLHDPYQVTTAYDMAVITKEALRYPQFQEFIATVRHDIPPTERQPLVRELLNSNRMIRPGQHFNESVVGGKTGFTSQSQHTLMTFAERDGRQLIVVTLQGEGSHLYTDTAQLLEYAFSIPYESQPLFYRSQYLQTIPVYDNWSSGRSHQGEVRLVVPEDVYLELPHGFDISEVEYQLYAPSQLTAPIQAGEDIGRVIYSIRGISMGDIQLRAANSVVLPPVVEAAPSAEIYLPPEESTVYERSLFNLDDLLENYYITVLLPLIIFIFIAGLILSAVILKIHRSRRQARLGHYSVIGSQIYRR